MPGHSFRDTKRRRGAVAVMVLVFLSVMFGFAALTVDVGAMYNAKSDLQHTADAAALAAIQAYASTVDKNTALTDAFQDARTMAASNYTFLSDRTFVLEDADIQFGQFILETTTFIPDALPFDSVRVVARLSSNHPNGPLDLMFANIFGKHSTHLQAHAVAMLSPASTVYDGVPMALPVPGFGPVDPEIAEANPGKTGPSEPEDGISFKVGDQITLFIFGKGKKSPVHLILNPDDIPGEAELGKVMNGEEPGISLSLGDELTVLGEGTGHNGLGGKLADRLTDDDSSNDTIVVPIIERIENWNGTYSGEPTIAQRSRNNQGDLIGHVRVVDFLTIHLDGIVTDSVPDPNDPQDNGKTIDIELLVGTIVQRTIGGASGGGSGVVDGASAAILQLVQ